MTLKYEQIFNYFEKKIPVYYKSDSIRTSQVQMAMDIADFVQKDNSDEIMIIEAPVGTGKSLGAMVPVLNELKNDTFNSRSLLYATATINLQGQLMGSEVPLLNHLSLVENSVVAKGKAHYYCHKRFLQNKEGAFSPRERTSLQEFFERSNTGQRSELEDEYGVELSDNQWRKVELEATKGECDQCELNKVCTTISHRKGFFSPSNDLMITNHDQLIQSYLNINNDRTPIIPVTQGVIVIDEAHHFLENFLGRLEKSFSLRRFRGIAKSLQTKYKLKFKKLMDLIQRDFQRVSGELKGFSQGRYKIPESTIRAFKSVYDLLNESINDYESGIGNSQQAMELDEWTETLESFIHEGYVTWVDYENSKFSAISDTFPTDFRWMMEYLSRRNKIIIMSGTLTVGGDFDSLIEQWRLKGRKVVTKQFTTPFDFKNQSKIYVPTDIPLPREESFVNGVFDTIERLIRLTEGKTLLLNTSKEHMDVFHERLKLVTDDLSVTLFKQGQYGVEKLTKNFREDVDSVLVGSGSYFSGFSIPGVSLTSVILNKLPFPVNDDPFLELIGQGYEGDDFFDYIRFPHMVNKLNQAIGRLIRGIKDFGIVTILDKRVFTSKQYGQSVQQILADQGYTLTRDWSEVEAFYARKVERGSEADYSAYSDELITVPPALNRPVKSSKAADQKTTNEKAEEKKPKLNGVTKRQREFVKKVCEEEGIPKIKGRYVEDLYIEFVSALYFEWKDIQPIKDDFPFRDEKEKALLTAFVPTKRRTFLPKCTKFGCNGNCSSKIKDEIVQYFEEKYDADQISFSESPNHCWVNVTPLTILYNGEFKPSK
ncbi:ATP-dependent DNA helicase [Virgibacillus oceani]